MAGWRGNFIESKKRKPTWLKSPVAAALAEKAAESKMCITRQFTTGTDLNQYGCEKPTTSTLKIN